MKVDIFSILKSSTPLLLSDFKVLPIYRADSAVREPSPLKVFCCRVGVLRLFDAFKAFRARSVNLSTLFPGKPPRQFTSIVSAHSFANYHFLNQRKGDNGRRIFFMIILLPRMCAGREDGIRDRPHTRRTRVRPSYHARQRNSKVGELFIQQSG